tara:strand:- start:659 stop:1015 length:357 start_codon:yes stop_codon:yes gene_type:complete
MDNLVMSVQSENDGFFGDLRTEGYEVSEGQNRFDVPGFSRKKNIRGFLISLERQDYADGHNYWLQLSDEGVIDSDFNLSINSPLTIPGYIKDVKCVDDFDNGVRLFMAACARLKGEDR